MIRTANDVVAVERAVFAKADQSITQLCQLIEVRKVTDEEDAALTVQCSLAV